MTTKPTLKGILIDPFTQTLKEVEIGRDYREIYKQIDADCFTCVHLKDGDAIYVDDEFLFKDVQAFWQIGTADLANKGLVLGSDEEGESQSCKITIRELAPMITWRPHAQVVGWTKGEEIQHAKGTFEIIMPRPKLGPKDE